jgi:protein SCO1
MGRATPSKMAFWMLFLVAACRGSDLREYELRGHVLAVNPARQEITIRHEDIRGFMPGMTMPFKVLDGKLLEGRAAGDLVRATLVVDGAEAYLRALERTGFEPVAGRPAASAPMDLLDVGASVPDVEFTDQTGAPRRLSGWGGRAVAVTFIYTRCPLPDFCPVMDRHFRSVQAAVQQDERLKGRVQLLSVSFDPAFDNPGVLAQHAARVGADPSMWSFLTGEPAAIDTFASRFGVSVMRDDPAEQEIVHNLRTAVLDRERRLTAILRGNDWTPAQLVGELRKAVAVE